MNKVYYAKFCTFRNWKKIAFHGGIIEIKIEKKRQKDKK